MSYVIMHNSNSLASTQIPRKNYQLTNQPRITLSRSPIIYKNTKVFENKVVIPNQISNVAPKIINQTIIKQTSKCFSAIQSPKAQKVIISSFSPMKIIPQNLVDRQRSLSPIIQNSSKAIYISHQDEIVNSSMKEQQNISKISSPNISQLNMINTKNQTITNYHSSLATNAYCQSTNTLNTDQNIQTQFQQSTNYETSKQETLKSQNTRDFLSSKSSQMYRSTTYQENDQALLDIVNKYIGGSSNKFSKVALTNYHNNNNSNKYQATFNVEQNFEQLQPSENYATKNQQYNNILSSHFESCSKGNYSSIEESQRSQQQQSTSYNQYNQQIEYLLASARNKNLNQNDSQSSGSQQSVQLDDYNKQIYQNAEQVKQQLSKIQEQMKLIKQETLNYHTDNTNNLYQNQNTQSINKGSQDLIQCTEYIIPPYQNQANKQEEALNKEEKNAQKQKTCVVEELIDPEIKQQQQIPKLIQSEDEQPFILQFTECSNNQPQKNNSVEDEDNDKLNLAVYEDENQLFDFNSTDNFDDDKKKQEEKEKNALKSEQNDNNYNQRTQKTQSTPQPLDPIQEEDFLSRSSIDNAVIRKQDCPVGSYSNIPSFTQIQNENNFNQGFSENKILSKQDSLQEQDIYQQNKQSQNQLFIHSSDSKLKNNDINNKIEDEFQLFDSNFDEIACIGERGSQDNLFSQDSYENILDLYNSGQNIECREIQTVSQKPVGNKDHHRSSSDATNCSQNFQTVSSIDTESFRRSLVNLASFGHSPQISLQGNDQQNNQQYSATFNQDTLPSEQSPGTENKSSRLNQLIIDQYQKQQQQYKQQYQQQQQSNKNNKEKDSQQIDKPVLQDTSTTTAIIEEGTQTKQQKNTVGDIIVIIIFIVLVMLIGCFFIFFIQDNSFIGQIKHSVQEKQNEMINQFSADYQYQEDIFLSVYENIYEIQQCFNPN